MNPEPYADDLRITGDEGPAVVLVPGMDGTGQLFYRQVPQLARRYRVATYALREDARSMTDLVADLIGVIDRVAGSGGRAIVIGESFGGTIALSSAIAHPERLISAVVVNSFPFFAPQARLLAARLALRVLPWGAMALVRRFTVHRMHSPHTERAELEEFMRRTQGIRRAGYLNRLDLLREYDVRADLARIQVPLLLVASECDHLVPSVEQARLIAAAVRGAELRVLEGHGHICLIAPDVDLLEILSTWRAGTSGSAPRGA